MNDPDDFHPTHSPDALRALAWSQRWVIRCVVAQLVLWAGYGAAVALGAARAPDRLWFVPVVGSLVAGAFAALFAFLLVSQLHDGGLGVVVGVLALLPCFGVVVLLVVVRHATRELRENGIRVGPFGARAADLAPPEPDYGHIGSEEDEGW